MATISFDVADTYTPQTTNEQIVVTVQVGDGELESYLVLLGTSLKGMNAPTTLGTAADVAGKQIITSATVLEALAETRWTSVTVLVTEGTHQRTYGPYSKEVTTQLDIVSYTLRLTTV